MTASQTERLTMAQALIKFLKQQYVERDGLESPFFAGCFGIFGHGCVAGVGEARVGAEAFAVKPGDAIVTPPGTAHALHNTGSAPLVFVNIVSIANDDPVSTTELER